MLQTPKMIFSTLPDETNIKPKRTRKSSKTPEQAPAIEAKPTPFEEAKTPVQLVPDQPSQAPKTRGRPRKQVTEPVMQPEKTESKVEPSKSVQDVKEEKPKRIRKAKSVVQVETVTPPAQPEKRTRKSKSEVTIPVVPVETPKVEVETTKRKRVSKKVEEQSQTSVVEKAEKVEKVEKPKRTRKVKAEGEEKKSN